LIEVIEERVRIRWYSIVFFSESLSKMSL